MSRTRQRDRWTDVSVGFRGGCRLRLIERPGMHFDNDALERLVTDLRQVADRCVPGGQLRYGVLSGGRKRLADALLAIAYDRRTGKAIGFNAMSLLDITLQGRPTSVLHAGLCMIDPGHRSRGLCWGLTTAPAVLAFMRNRLSPMWVTNVTQVPAVAGVFATALENVYPVPGIAEPASDTHREVVTAVMLQHRAAFGVGDDADFDPDRFVIRNAYTGGSDHLKKTFTQAAKHRDGRFNVLCSELLDYDRGDDLIQVGRMTCVHWGRLVLRFVRALYRSGRELPEMRRRPTKLSPLQGAGVR